MAWLSFHHSIVPPPSHTTTPNGDYTMNGTSTTIGPEPQLVVEDLLIQSMQGVRRRLHPGRKLPGPVLEANQPWEGVRVYVYGTIVYDANERVFKVWYLARMGAGFEERCPGILRQGVSRLSPHIPDNVRHPAIRRYGSSSSGRRTEPMGRPHRGAIGPQPGRPAMEPFRGPFVDHPPRRAGEFRHRLHYIAHLYTFFSLE